MHPAFAAVVQSMYHGAMNTQPSTETDPQLSGIFLEFSRRKLLDEYWPRLKSTVEPLSEAQVWFRPNPASNSIGNLILHLEGNVGQWLVTSFKGLRDERNRPVEFSERRLLSTRDLLGRLGATLEQAGETLAHLKPDHLTRVYEIQGYTVTGLEAVYQVVDHFAMHYGQILYIVKALTATDLGFYSVLNRTGRAS